MKHIYIAMSFLLLGFMWFGYASLAFAKELSAYDQLLIKRVLATIEERAAVQCPRCPPEAAIDEQAVQQPNKEKEDDDGDIEGDTGLADELTTDTQAIPPKVKKLLDYAKAHKHATSQKLCWGHVQDALVAAALVPSGWRGSGYKAKQAGTPLEQAGFKKLNHLDFRKAPVGAVFVFNAVDKNGKNMIYAGHTEIKLNDRQLISDFIRNGNVQGDGSINFKTKKKGYRKLIGIYYKAE